MNEYHFTVSSHPNKPHILGVLAGGDMPSEQVAKWAESADIVVAADGGADTLLHHGIVANQTIGDLDSITWSTKVAQKELTLESDQDTTDCDKLLALLVRQNRTEVTLCGMEGDLVDHMLGSLNSAGRSPLQVRFALRRGVALILKDGCDLRLDVPAGARLSLLPLIHCHGISLTGVQWPLSDAVMEPLGFSSLSNRVVGSLRVSMKQGVAALFLGHPALESPHWSY